MDLEAPQNELEVPSNEEKYMSVFMRFKKGDAKTDLASEYGVSVRTIDRWIANAREVISNDLVGVRAKNFRGDIFLQYQHVYELAEDGFKQTGNPNFLKEMRQVTGQMATLLGLNAPPKAAIQGEDTDDIPEGITFELDESQYKQAETIYKQSREKIINYSGEIIDLPEGENKE